MLAVNVQRVLFETVTVLFFMGKMISIPLTQEYVTFMLMDKHNYSTSMDRHHGRCELDYDTDHSMKNRVFKETTMTVLYLNVAELLPSVIVVFLLATWSDRTGRRNLLLWLPCLGNALYAILFVVSNYATQYTQVFLYVGAVLAGLSGSLTGFFSGNAAIIADSDSEDNRSTRLAIVELIVGCSFGVTSFITGFWVNATGFIQPGWFMFACSILALIIILVWLREPTQEVKVNVDYNHKDLLSVKSICTCREKRRVKFWAVFLAFQVFVFVQQGHERTYVLFLGNYPLCWQAAQIGIFFFILMVVSGLGSYPGVKLLHLIFDDLSIAILSVVSKGAGTFLLAMANNYITTYISCVLQIFQLLPFAVTRSIMSKMVAPSELASAYGVIHSTQSIMTFLGPVAMNAIYASTLTESSGFVFLISGGILAIPIVLFAVVKYLETCHGSNYETLESPMLEKSQYGSTANEINPQIDNITAESTDEEDYVKPDTRN